MNFIEILKIIFLGIVEGITEWLPISSTGHMLLVDEFFTINQSAAFKEMFFVVIQLGAILAVVLIFWDRMVPIEKNNNKWQLKSETINLWMKVAVALVPGTIITLLFDDFIEANLQTPLVIAIALIFYGVIFIVVEERNKNKLPTTKSLMDITYKTAFIIGVFQILSIIPGTSRSGSTIVGGLLIGVSRIAVAEFTFFVAVPVMFGLSALKLLKFGLIFTSGEIITLLLGSFVAFIVSLFVIKFLMDYIKKNDFKVFGWYRIILGLIVILYFTLF